MYDKDIIICDNYNPTEVLTLLCNSFVCYHFPHHLLISFFFMYADTLILGAKHPTPFFRSQS